MELISLVDEEPAFAEGLDERGRRQAERRLHVPSVTLSPGPGTLRRRPGSRRSASSLSRVSCCGGCSSAAAAAWSCSPGATASFPRARTRSASPRPNGTPPSGRCWPCSTCGAVCALSAWPALGATLATRVGPPLVPRSRSSRRSCSVVGVEERLHALLWVLGRAMGPRRAGGSRGRGEAASERAGRDGGERAARRSAQALGTLGAHGAIVSRGNGIWSSTGEPPKKSS